MAVVGVVAVVGGTVVAVVGVVGGTVVAVVAVVGGTVVGVVGVVGGTVVSDVVAGLVFGPRIVGCVAVELEEQDLKSEAHIHQLFNFRF